MLTAFRCGSNLDWMRYGHAPYTGSVLNKHGEAWESYPYGDANAYLDSYTGRAVCKTQEVLRRLCEILLY